MAILAEKIAGDAMAIIGETIFGDAMAIIDEKYVSRDIMLLLLARLINRQDVVFDQ